MALEIEWTRHARRRMRQRHVTEAEVRQTLARLDRTATGSDGHPVAFRHFDDKGTVRVAYVVEGGVYVVKTVVCRPERGE